MDKFALEGTSSRHDDNDETISRTSDTSDTSGCRWPVQSLMARIL